MSCPEFKVGDLVECERGEYDLPRWNYNRDTGGSGVYMRGKVTDVYSDHLTVEFDNGHVWGWPLADYKNYSDDQWKNPGYLRFVRAEGNYQRDPGKLRLVDKGGYYGMEEIK